MEYIIYQIDAFTYTLFKGNPAGVVVNADGLSDTQMQMIAKELNNSETAFLLSPKDAANDGAIRYFTPTTEVPICGHATISAIFVKALEEKVDSHVFMMETQVGTLPIEVTYKDNKYLIKMVQGKPLVNAPISASHKQGLLEALGISSDDMDERCPIQIASTGHSKVMIGIKNKETLNRLSPNMDALNKLSHDISCNGYYVFVLGNEKDDVFVNGRMFAPAIGINEDPVTGNANGPLGAYLVHNKIVDTGKSPLRFVVKQGEKMGREGMMEVIVDINNHQSERVTIIGEAVVVFKTVIRLD